MNRSDDYPRAILHFDGDSFFASVEQAKDWTLKGKPVITGAERGSATSLSKEAKQLGLHRGMPVQEIKRRCPEAILVAGDYTAYSIYARRMYAIVREYASEVEEYSIDECFADITGIVPAEEYESLARRIKEHLEESLGITFGVGLAPTKTLAKVASKRQKPAGLTFIPTHAIEQCLSDTDIDNVWGLGGASGVRMRSLGVFTALDYIRKSDSWLKEHAFVKPQRDTWLELQGYPVLGFSEHYAHPHSIMMTRTFTPPSTDRAFIFSQLSKNVEGACAKLRRSGMKTSALSFYLKTQEFTYHGVQLDLPTALDAPVLMLDAINERFDEVYATEIPYRASGVTLRALKTDAAVIPDLFGAYEAGNIHGDTFGALDAVNKKYGRNTLYLGSSMQAHTAPVREQTRIRQPFLRSGPSKKKSLDLPFLGGAQ